MNYFTFLKFISILLLSSNIYAFDFDLVAQLQGTLSGDPINGDLFGQAVAINSFSNAIIGAPSASPNGLDQAGATYFFSSDWSDDWQQSQNPYPGQAPFDLVASPLIVSRGDWLFVSAPGTPLNDSNPQDKDFSGAVLVFRRSFGQWNLVQTIYNPLGLAGAGSFFGANIAYDGGSWFVVGGFNVQNAWFYSFNPRTELWELANIVTPPNPSGIPGYVFVSISGNYAAIGQPVPLLQTFNSNVYTYKLNHSSKTWSLTQTLSGINNPISFKYGTGDYFGEFISMSGEWLAISAPYDNQLGDITGAVYLFKLINGEVWEFQQKLFSDKPSALFGFGVAISG